MRIDALSPEKMRDTLSRVVHDNHDYNFLRHPHPPESSKSSWSYWCISTLCRDVPTQAAILCCGKSQDNCVSRLPISWSRTKPGSSDTRCTACLVYDIIGCSGSETCRRVVWTCCLRRIRDKFPDLFGQYMAFKTDRLQ